MSWHATDEHTLMLRAPNDESIQRAGLALDVLALEGAVESELVGQLRPCLGSQTLQAASLAALGRLCHSTGAAREPARGVSLALFGLVLPTPGLAQESDFFWRVARALNAVTYDATRPGPVDFRVFNDRADAATFATEVGAGLVSITESSASPSGAPVITVWFK